MIFKRYPRLSIGILCVSLFTLGFFRERFTESERVQTLVESSAQADRDFSELVSAYKLRLDTVHALVNHALKHKVIIPSALVLVLDRLDDKPDVHDADELAEYQTQQASLAQGARDLITEMDTDLPEMDGEFVTLYKEFLSQQSQLEKIISSYAQQTRRMRALARKGDRKFLSPGMRLPSSVRENL